MNARPPTLGSHVNAGANCTTPCSMNGARPVMLLAFKTRAECRGGRRPAPTATAGSAAAAAAAVCDAHSLIILPTCPAHQPCAHLKQPAVLLIGHALQNLSNLGEVGIVEPDAKLFVGQNVLVWLKNVLLRGLHGVTVAGI